MALTLEEVRHIAALARLRLSTDEEERYREQLSAVLEAADRLAKVDTAAIPPTATVLPLQAPLRPDVVRPCPPRERLLANAADSTEGMFRVPRVLDSDS